MRKFLRYVCVLISAAAALPLHAGSETYEVTRTTTVTSTGVPRFTLEEAILTALQRNPSIQRARQEIERQKGVYLEVRAQILPRVDATGQFSETDRHLTRFTGDGGGPDFGTNQNYSIQIRASQTLFAGGRIVSQIRASDFSRDASYFAFRDTIDLVIAAVRQQFALILLNRALIGVQEESVRLLQSQLQDQQNRFEAGTVPRFNVLQAQVALSNQQPELISARNNYRIAQLELARTIGLDFDPTRGDAAPLEAVGVLRQEVRNIPLPLAIEIAKERRPLLKAQKAQVLSSNAQVGVARSGFFPTITATGGADFRSSPLTTDFNDVRSGYVYGFNGSWAIWDWGQTWGRVRQARAVLEQQKISLDDINRQVEVEVQQAYSNMQQGRELIRSQQQTVGQADEALRLASARLSAGAGTQLEVLNARVEVTRAQSISLQALYSYNAAVAEFDRVTATEFIFANALDEPRTRARAADVEVRPTPAPKPTPLPLNNAGNRPPPPGAVGIHRTTTTTTGGKAVAPRGR
jgi:outer membrane protein